jgi:hypothetical protein
LSALTFRPTWSTFSRSDRHSRAVDELAVALVPVGRVGDDVADRRDAVTLRIDVDARRTDEPMIHPQAAEEEGWRGF